MDAVLTLMTEECAAALKTELNAAVRMVKSADKAESKRRKRLDAKESCQGYFRVVFAFVSFYYMPTDYGKASFLYLLNWLLDEIDGRVARMLNQCSKLGAILDQLIDRINSMCLCAALCHFYPRNMLFFQFAMALDIFSHWLHVHSSLLKGSDSHKNVDLSVNPLLRIYYHNAMFMSILCAANEFFLCMLYLVYFTPGPTLPLGPLSVGVFKLILYISAPVSLLKNYISVVQLVAAAQNIAMIDQQDRAQAAAKTK